MSNSSKCQALTDLAARPTSRFKLRRDPHSSRPRIALLTGGGDRHYALGLASALIANDIGFDFIGSDELVALELQTSPGVNFLNLRGSTRVDAHILVKVLRLATYYLKLIHYSFMCDATIFHILWNNKFDFFDRIVLMIYYRCLGKRVVLTAHNINAGKRDGNDSCLNRFSLRIQYRLADHILVHTEKMKAELLADFGVPTEKATVIPYGINDRVADTSLTAVEAKERLGLKRDENALLFFGAITAYKGLEYAVRALAELRASSQHYRLIIAGRPKGDVGYWKSVKEEISRNDLDRKVIIKSEFIPDADIEMYFKAADVLLLPYTHIFQSGVLFLGHSFGLPVIAADVGSLKEEIIDGVTGLMFKPKDPFDLADAINRYFASDLFQNLESRRLVIKKYASEQHSWNRVASITSALYVKLAGI